MANGNIDNVSIVLKLATRLYEQREIGAFIEVEMESGELIHISHIHSAGFKRIDPALMAGMEVDFYTEQDIHNLFDTFVGRE